MDALIELLNACVADPTRCIFQYIFAMEPPTYLQARYLDWVKPYIQDQIDYNLRNHTAQFELDNAIKANQLFTKLISEANIT